MSVYNGARFLVPAMESVLSQSFADFEFLVLDDGSGDETPAIIRAFAARDDRVRPIIRENRGLIASLNELLATARAPVIARMDADDICHPERFVRQMAFLAAYPDHGVVGSWSEDIDEHDRPWAHSPPDPPTHWPQIERALDEGRSVLIHPSVMYRRDLVLEAGGYHAAFRHCEDYDLWLRLASRTRMANLPDRLLRYRHYAGQVSKRHRFEQARGAAIAREAYLTRKAGRPDPTADMTELPPVDALADLFDDAAAAGRVRQRTVDGLLHSRAALGGEGFAFLLDHVARGGSHAGLWRTVLRLASFGMPVRALRLATALLRS